MSGKNFEITTSVGYAVGVTKDFKGFLVILLFTYAANSLRFSLN